MFPILVSLLCKWFNILMVSIFHIKMASPSNSVPELGLENRGKLALGRLPFGLTGTVRCLDRQTPIYLTV